MKKVYGFVVLFLSVLSLSHAQNDNWNSSGWGGKLIKGEGETVKESRNVTGFTGVQSGISADVYLKQGSSFKLEVEGQKNILELLKTEVVNGELKIKFEKGYSIRYKNPLKIYIEAPSYDYLGMSGSGNVKAEKLSGDKLNISISGSGDFDLGDVQYKLLDLGISGSGNVEIAGSVETTEIHVSGSGDVSADDLKSQKVECHVSGSGNITCNAADVLTAHVSGSGDIRYKGNPKSVKTRVSGSGDVEPIK
jgi:DUF4097 and DUF4098 domain-containing protein YvlB